MPNILSPNDIDALLDCIRDGKSSINSETDFDIPDSNIKDYYDFKKPDIISRFQIEKIGKFMEEVIPDISNYFTNLLEKKTTFHLCNNYDSIFHITLGDFIFFCPQPCYMYSFTINGEVCYFEIDPILFNNDFLKRNDKNNEIEKIGKFELNVCLNCLVKPILEIIKPMFYLNGKKVNYSKIENTEHYIKNNNEMFVCISMELLHPDKNISKYLNIALSRGLISKMKENGIIKTDDVVFIGNEKGNAEVVLGKFHLENESEIEVGKIYEVNSSSYSNVDILLDNKIIATGLPLKFFNNYSVEVDLSNKELYENQVLDKDSDKESCESQCKVGQSIKNLNTKVVVGRFVLPNNTKLEDKQIINLDRNACDPFDIVFNGKIIAKAEPFASDEILGVKIIRKV